LCCIHNGRYSFFRQNDDGPAEYQVKSYELARKLGDNAWVLTNKKTGLPMNEGSPEVLHALRFDVSFGFDDVFASTSATKKTFEAGKLRSLSSEHRIDPLTTDSLCFVLWQHYEKRMPGSQIIISFPSF